MMSDYQVCLGESTADFYVKFKGPKDSEGDASKTKRDGKVDWELNSAV